MNKNILIICDSDKNYLKKLDGYIRDNLSISFEIYGITDTDRLSGFIEKGKNILLLISQSLYERSAINGFEHVLVLREKEKCLSEDEPTYGNQNADIRYTDKYQKSEKITDTILSMCLDIPGLVVKGKDTLSEDRMKVTGFYTPVLNNNQTKEAISYAKELSKNKKTIYINTDCLCTNETIRNEAYEETLIDLMYFAECAGDKFGIYLERILKHDNEMDFIPASNSACQSRMITAKEYEKLIGMIGSTGKYENLILDISEGVRDLFGMIHLCDELYMLWDDDYFANMRSNIFLEELKNDDSFDMKKLHRISRSGGSVL